MQIVYAMIAAAVLVAFILFISLRSSAPGARENEDGEI